MELGRNQLDLSSGMGGWVGGLVLGRRGGRGVREVLCGRRGFGSEARVCGPLPLPVRSPLGHAATREARPSESDFGRRGHLAAAHAHPLRAKFDACSHWRVHTLLGPWSLNGQYLVGTYLPGFGIQLL